MRKRTSTKMTALVLVLALVLLLSGCGYKEEIAQAAALIEAIGTVTLESEDAILAAEDAFAALPEKARAKVENAAALTAARESYDARLAAVSAAQAQLDALETLPLEKLADIAALEAAISGAEAALAALPEADRGRVDDPSAAVAAAQARIESEKPGLFYAALQIEDEAQEWPMHEVYTLQLVSDTGEEKTVLARLSAGEDGVCRFSELFSDIELLRLSGYTPGEALPEGGAEVLEAHPFFAGYRLESLTAKIKPELPSPVEDPSAESGDDGENAEGEEKTLFTPLESEEEIAAEVEKLCILDDGAELNALYLSCLAFEKNGQEKLMPVYFVINENDVSYFDPFTNELLFNVNNNEYENNSDQKLGYVLKDLKEYEALCPYFNDVEEISVVVSWYDFYIHSTLSTNSFSSEVFIMLLNEITDGTISIEGNIATYERPAYDYTREEIAKTYIKYTPEEYRVNAYDLYPDQYSEAFSLAEYAAWYLAAVPETARVYAESLRAVLS